MTDLERFLEKYGLWIVAGFGLYYFLTKAASAASAALQPVGSAIGSAIAAVTLPGDVNVTAAIVLPDGSTISANSIYLNDQMQFTYNGITYTLTGRDANNNYVAVRA